MLTNAKDYLSQATWLDQRINSKLEHIETLKAMAVRVTSNLTQQRVSGGNDVRSPMENTLIKLMDLERELNDDIDKLVDLKTSILETISQVDDPTCQLLLEMRYIHGKTWEEVARKLNYSDRGVHKMHGRALKEIEKLKRVQ